MGFVKKLITWWNPSPKDEKLSPYAGFTKPDIPYMHELTPTITRNGAHVVIGGPGERLRPDFIPSHETKRYLEGR
jgi:hypothetical protein